jgi:hypothetical protein
LTTISATVIKASVGRHAPPLYSMILEYPLPIHAEYMTHRAFSKNSASLRAIPTKTVVKNIRKNPFTPIHWGKNQPGMRADEENSELVAVPRKDFIGRVFNLMKKLPPKEAYIEAMEAAIVYAESFAEANYHKQVVNRILSPYLHNRVMHSAVNIDNFYALRDHKDAEPHIHELAVRVKEAVATYGDPQFLDDGEWHLPWITTSEFYKHSIEDTKKVSVARCARVSYNLVTGEPSDFYKDLELYEKLIISKPVHASPTEHQAKPDFVKKFSKNTGRITWQNPDKHGNLTGWQQNRKFIVGETVPDQWLIDLQQKLTLEAA